METVTVRRPHAKYDLKKPALASLIGTENGPFLNDPTGTRRFAVIELQGKPEEAIKWSYTDELDVNQIWAEAMAAYKDGESNRLTDDEKKRQAQINAGHTAISATVEVFFKVYDIDPNDDDWYTAADIIHDLEFAGLKVTQQMAYRELNELLSNEPGVTKGRPDVNGRRVTAYKGLVRI